MNRQVIVNKKLKREEDRKKISGTHWKEKDGYILRLWSLYKNKRISAEVLMNHFPGRTFHAIFSKVYAIKGRQGTVHRKTQDPNQLVLPFGGAISESKSKH